MWSKGIIEQYPKCYRLIWKMIAVLESQDEASFGFLKEDERWKERMQ